MDRETYPWLGLDGRARVHGVARIGHDLTTKPPPIIYVGLTRMFFLSFSQSKPGKNSALSDVLKKSKYAENSNTKADDCCGNNTGP